MLMTERKASIGAANLLRLLRSSSSSSKTITLCFPNMQNDECIVKIDVTWENYLFNLNLTRYQNIPLGIQSIMEVLHQQNEKLPTTVSRFKTLDKTYK